MPKITQSPFQIHKSKWGNCTLCPLCEGRKHVVFARGKLPCDVLFIGEAPGINEDAEGIPFHGPAGKLLDRMILDAGGERLRIAFTNLIACIPLDEEGKKVHEPPEESIEACAPRLNEMVRIAKPRAVVLVGKHAKKYISGQGQFGGEYAIGKDDRVKKLLAFAEIVHPAYILQADVSQKGLAIQRTIVTLNELFLELDNA